jgi:hypothetical protein
MNCSSVWHIVVLRSHHPPPPPPLCKAQSRHGKNQSAQPLKSLRVHPTELPRAAYSLTHSLTHTALQFPHAILLLAISAFLPAKSISFTWNPWPWILMDYILAEMGDIFETEAPILSFFPPLLPPSFIFFGKYVICIKHFNLSESYRFMAATVFVLPLGQKTKCKKYHEQLCRFSLHLQAISQKSQT